MPKVSVIIPVYGVEKYIERCARSLFEQTLDDMEYLFIDDCSLDQSINILNRIIEEYPNRKSQIIIHRMESNSGQAKVREWGIKNASGEYIIHCDSDDWVDLSMYEKMYNLAKSQDLDFVMCNFYITDGKENYIDNDLHKITHLDRDGLIKGILSGNFHRATWNKLIKRILYDKLIYYPQNNMWEDVAIISQLVYYCYNVGYLDEALYYYYLNPTSISSNKTIEAQREKTRQTKSNVELVQQFYSTKSDYKIYKKHLTKMKFGVLSYAKLLKHQEYLSVFPKENLNFLVCSEISLRQKIGHLLRLCGFDRFIRIINK